MTQIKDMPVLPSVPAGGYVLVTDPTSNPAASIFAKVPASSLGGTDLSTAPVLSSVPAGGYVLISNPFTGGISDFVKVPASVLGGPELSGALFSDRASGTGGSGGGGSSTPFSRIVVSATSSTLTVTDRSTTYFTNTTAGTYTLPNPTTDNTEIELKRWGAGSLTINGSFDGAAGTISAASSTLKEAILLRGVVADATLGTTWVVR